MQARAITLSELLVGFADVPSGCELTSITLDSRNVTEGALFVALKGTLQHGLSYAEVARKNGAAAIIWESDDAIAASSVATSTDSKIPEIEIKDLRDKLGLIANRFYASPSHSLNMIGITGTDGKTSVSHFIAQALEQSAVIGTIGIGPLDDLQTASLTTPDVITVHKNLAEMKSQGISSIAMEVSSHALDQGRVSGVEFDVAVLTNLTRDHLDYHGTVEAYAKAKERLFNWPGLKAIVANLDDEFGQKIVSKAKEKALMLRLHTNNSVARFKQQNGKLIKKSGGGAIASKSTQNGEQQAMTIVAYGVGKADQYPESTLVAENAEFGNEGIKAAVVFGDQQGELKASVLGRFNLSNLLAALGAMLAMDMSLKDALVKINTVQTVAGRMEKVASASFLTVVDYAHTPNALASVLKALREHAKNNLICVFGCGGDRDAGKRPLMAAVAEKYADEVIVTDDNPRSESPQEIMKDIVAGFINPESAKIEHDRATAIQIALNQAKTGDAVLIAGKGHENVQILANGTIPFSDRQQAAKVLQELAA